MSRWAPYAKNQYRKIEALTLAAVVFRNGMHVVIWMKQYFVTRAKVFLRDIVFNRPSRFIATDSWGPIAGTSFIGFNA